MANVRYLSSKLVLWAAPLSGSSSLRPAKRHAGAVHGLRNAAFRINQNTGTSMVWTHGSVHRGRTALGTAAVTWVRQTNAEL